MEVNNQNISSLLSEINNQLSAPFWQHFEFWLGLLNILLLGATLYYLVKSTRSAADSAKASQKMTNEMLQQRLSIDAHDVDFDMQENYLPTEKEGLVMGRLLTEDVKNKITLFTFITSNYSVIGNGTKFQNKVREDRKLEAMYRMETDGQRRTFLENLQSASGFIKAKVVAASGTEFIYTYRAISDNWKKIVIYPPEANHQHEPLRDTFVLVSKKIDDDYLKKLIKGS